VLQPNLARGYSPLLPRSRDRFCWRFERRSSIVPVRGGTDSLLRCTEELLVSRSERWILEQSLFSRKYRPPIPQSSLMSDLAS
jgi:hypothetical protein